MTTRINKFDKVKEIKEIREEIRKNVLKDNKILEIKIQEITNILNELKQEKGKIENRNKYYMKDLIIKK